MRAPVGYVVVKTFAVWYPTPVYSFVYNIIYVIYIHTHAVGYVTLNSNHVSFTVCLFQCSNYLKNICWITLNLWRNHLKSHYQCFFHFIIWQERYSNFSVMHGLTGNWKNIASFCNSLLHRWCVITFLHIRLL